MDKIYVEVAINTPIRKTFTYEVDGELGDEVEVGKRVWVPFNKREVVGYIVGLPPADQARPYRVREIVDILDVEPVVSGELLKLTGWIATYYMCSWGEVLDSALPAGIKIGSLRTVQMKKERYDLLEGFFEDKKRSPKAEEIIRFLLKEEDRVPINRVYTEVGKKGTYAALSSLQREGLVVISSEVRLPELKPKTVRTVELLDPDIEDRIEELSKKAPKQVNVLKVLMAKDEELTPAQLAEMAGVSSSVIKTLADKGIVEFVEKTVDRDPFGHRQFTPDEKFILAPEQKTSYEEIKKTIDKGGLSTILLHGVTGSGKTEVYMQAIEYVLSKGKTAIVLVPEIALTPQAVERFRSRFTKGVAVLHSALSEGERYDEWRRIKRGEVGIVIGARSAIFAPIENIGLIVVDEEHETSYKQESSPRYHARDVAIMRAKFAGATVVLGTATPTLESYSNTRTGKFIVAPLLKRIDDRPLPEVKVVDMRSERKRGNRSIFSGKLQAAIGEHLARKEQVILFLNRRGFATFALCPDCGYVVNCPNCSITLTYHRQKMVMRCHYCNYQRKPPDICPKCQSLEVRYFGVGTQKIENELHRLFPEARSVRMDVDTTSRKGSHEKILSAFGREEFDILVGTQMVAKGLDYPKVTLIGVISADTTLNIPDFRAGERTFALLTQVAGRTGRGSLGGEVIIQTYNPDHYSVRYACGHDYPSFYEEEIITRQELSYPPFSRLISVTVQGSKEKVTADAAVGLGSLVAAIKKRRGMEGIDILGPAPAPVPKIKGRYRWQVVIKGTDYKNLHYLAETGIDQFKNGGGHPGVNLIVDVDPLTLS